MRIETPRLVIRSFTRSDIPDYAAIVADPAVMKYLGKGSPLSRGAADAYVEGCLRSERDLGYARYAVLLRAAGKLIGFSGFKLINGYVDFGYRLAAEHWGSGYATEAGRAVIAYGFEQLGLKSIVATADMRNAGSIRVIEKLGFTFERTDGFSDHAAARYVLERS